MQQTQNNKTTLIVAITIVLVVSIVVYGYLQTQQPQQTITTTGESTLEITPDLTIIYLRIETLGNTSEEAKNQNSVIYDKLLAAIVKKGFSSEDLKTENYNVYEDYDWSNNKQTFRGMKATHSLTIEVSANDTKRLGDIIDATIDSGALLSYMNFELTKQHQEELKAEAIKSAAANAKLKATAMAEGLGKKLGDVVSSSDSQFGYQPWRAYDATPMASSVDLKAEATNIQPSSQEITATISVVYEIK